MQLFAPPAFKKTDKTSTTALSESGTSMPELFESGMTRISLAERDESAAKIDGFYLMPVSSEAVLLTLNQLAVMSQNGVELAEAVGHVARHCQDPRLAASFQAIHESVSGGSRFSTAVARYGLHFPQSLPAMLAAAEATGEVPNALAKACERMRDEIELRSSIVGSMIYPLILIIASAMVMTALFLGVLPQFGRVFASMGKPIPPSTRLLLDIGEFGQSHWIPIFLSLVTGLGVLLAFRKHPLVQRPLTKLFLYAPMIREAYRPLTAGRNFRTIAAMMRGGVPLLQAVQLTRSAVGDPAWRELLGRVEENLIDGLTASAAMSEVDFLPSEATQMMATAERTGRVSEVLEDIGRFYEQEGGRRIKRLLVALEPTIILVMGIVVAIVVMSVMLPLLDVSTVGP